MTAQHSMGSGPITQTIDAPTPRFTPGPWCCESVGEKNNAVMVGVAHRVVDEKCNLSGQLSGWLADFEDDGLTEIEYYREPVCCLDDSEVTGNVHANAALIAAAPDMYAALDALLPADWRDGVMDHMPGVKLAREALARARGEKVARSPTIPAIYAARSSPRS